MLHVKHWTEKYIGRPWIQNIHDCTDLVLQVQRLEFGRIITEPRGARDSRKAALAAIRSKARRLLAGDVPRDGDVVLMRALDWHLGVWCDPAGRPSVLHCARTTGTVLTPIDAVATAGMMVEGIYRCA